MKSFWFHMEWEDNSGFRRKGRAPSEEGEGRSQPTADFLVISANWWAVVRTGLKQEVLGGLCLPELICRGTHGRKCKVKWALGSFTMNKASGSDGIPVELFQILKDNSVKTLHSLCQQIEKIKHWPQDWKWSVFIPIPKKGNAKECSNCHTFAFISHASKVMLKILQARLQQYMNCQLPDVQDEFKKGRGTRVQIARILWLKKEESSRKISISALLTMPKPLTVWTTTNSGKFFKRWEYQTTWPASWEICMQIRKQQLELDMEQQTGSK